MNKKLLATIAIALFLVSTLSVLSVAPSAKADVCIEDLVTITITPSEEWIPLGEIVTINIADNNLTDTQLHNLTMVVTKPTGASVYKSFALDDNDTTYVFGGGSGKNKTDAHGTYDITVWENYYNEELAAWCQCEVGTDSFTVSADLIVDVYVINCTGYLQSQYNRCDGPGYIVAQIWYCNDTLMLDEDATVIATLTSPEGEIVATTPMNIDGDVWITENWFEAECFYNFTSDDCSGDWVVSVTAVDSEGNSGYGATGITVNAVELPVWEFAIGYYPECDTDNAAEPVVGYMFNDDAEFYTQCENEEYIFKRCEPVFFAAWVSDACNWSAPLEEGTVVVTLYTFNMTEDGYWNFTEPEELYTIELEYVDDDESDWYGYWTANWTVPLNATPVGFPNVPWWYVEDHYDTWWWANLTVSDEACGDPNEGTFEYCNYDIQAQNENATGLLPLWVSYNIPDIVISSPDDGDEFKRCETINFTVKVRYDCCNTPFTAEDGGNVSVILMAECYDEYLDEDFALLETIYLNDTGTHDSDGYEIWKGSFAINVTHPATWDEEDEVGLTWTMVVRAWDEAEPSNQVTKTQEITVGPAEADVKVCAWVDPNAGPDVGGKGYLYVCIKAWVCGEEVNGTDERTLVEVEIINTETGDPVGPIFSTAALQNASRVWWSEDTMSWCMNFCVACIAEDHPDWLGLWNVTVTVSDPGLCVANEGERTVSVPAVVINGTTWIDMECPVDPYSSVYEGCRNHIYVNQTTTRTVYGGILSFNATLLDGELEAKSVKAKIYNVDGDLVWSGLMTNASNVEDEDEVNYTVAVPDTLCLDYNSPGEEYLVVTEVEYEEGTSDDVWCAIVKPGCPACTVTCPAIPPEACGELTGCPDNNLLAQDGCNFTVVPEINVVNFGTLGDTFNPNSWVRFDGLINDGCDKPLEEATATITVKDPDGGVFGDFEATTDEDGRLMAPDGGLAELILPQNAKLGNYTWEATIGWNGSPYKYEDSEGTDWSFSVAEVDRSGSFLVYGKLSALVILSSNLVYNGSSVDVLVNVMDFFAGMPTTATVSGEVTKPDGTTQALTFTPVGTGIYKATYLVPATAAAGTYMVSYVVSKPLYTGASGSTAFNVELKTPLPTTTIPGTTTTATTTITPADITGLLYAIAAIAAIAMIAAIVAVIIIARKTR